MSALPSPIERGQPVSADALNRLADESRARTVTNGPLMVQQRGRGSVILRRPTGLHPAPRRSAAFAHPFKVSNASAATPAAARVKVRFGQVNNITPTINDVALGTTPEPVLSVATGVVFLEVTVDEGEVTTVRVLNAETVPANTADKGHIVLAAVTVANNRVTAINQSVTRSLGHQKCGGTIHNFWGV